MSATMDYAAGVRNRATAAIRQQIVLKFNDTGCQRSCTLCGTPFDVPLGIAAFIAGGHDPVCGACVADRAPALFALIGLSSGPHDPLHMGWGEYGSGQELSEIAAARLAYREISRLRAGFDRLRQTMAWLHPVSNFQGREAPTGDYFGNCPVCGSQGASYDVGGEIYNACEAHRICWPIANSFGLARDAMPEWSADEVERHCAENRATLSDFRVIDSREAVPPPGVMADDGSSRVPASPVPWDDSELPF